MQRQFGCGSLLVVLLAGAVVVALLAPGREYNEFESRPTERVATQLNAQVRKTATQVFVTNDDSFAWTNCSVELNAGVISSGWSQQVGRIEPGEEVSGGLMAFTRSGGERFNPGSHVVETVDVHCDTPTGRRHYNGAF